MKKAKVSIIIILSTLLIAGVSLFIIGTLRPKLAGIYIETTPAASVWIDGKQVGRTPFRDTVKPSDILIRLIPDSFEIPLPPYETKVGLVAGVETVVRYDFGETVDLSSGDIISFEKIPGNEVSLVAVSLPDSAQLTIDGLEKAFTPHKTSAVIAGVHELKFSLSGYQDRVVEVKTHDGYKLTAIAKLAKAAETVETETSSPSAETTDIDKEMVEILSTPVGYLRVRSQPSTSADEVGQVSPGEKYEFLGSDSVTGWYEIRLDEVKTGWISNQYAKKVVNPSVSPTISPRPSGIASPSASPRPSQSN